MNLHKSVVEVVDKDTISSKVKGIVPINKNNDLVKRKSFRIEIINKDMFSKIDIINERIQLKDLFDELNDSWIKKSKEKYIQKRSL
jgi:hypothetical protein